MEWELLGTVGLEEPEWDSTVMPRTSTATPLSFIFSSPVSYTALWASQGKMWLPYFWRLLERICSLSTFPWPSLHILTSPYGFLRIQSSRPQVPCTCWADFFELADYPSDCLTSQLKCPFSHWPVLIEAGSTRSLPYFRLPSVTDLGSEDVVYLYRCFLRVYFSSTGYHWIKEMNINYAQTSGIEKKI